VKLGKLSLELKHGVFNMIL